jgi:hypothetical protein
LLLTLPALPPECDRHAELRTPELANLREAARTDGAGISRAESVGALRTLATVRTLIGNNR